MHADIDKVKGSIRRNIQNIGSWDNFILVSADGAYLLPCMVPRLRVNVLLLILVIVQKKKSLKSSE